MGQQPNMKDNDPFLDFIDLSLRKLKKKIKIEIPHESIKEEEFEKKMEQFNKLVSDCRNLPISFIVGNSPADNQEFLLEIALEKKILGVHKQFRKFTKENIDNKSKEEINSLLERIKKETNWEKSDEKKFFSQIDKIEIKERETTDNKMDDIPLFVDYVQNRIVASELVFKSFSFPKEWSFESELDNIGRLGLPQATNTNLAVDIREGRGFKENHLEVERFMKKYI
ncbi:hypothetical protein CDIK_1613 [Cucumispora dikerogammari]|nr:hypothetical protein CDIK_1613 [Cucumispora dikerogammari]